MRIKLIEAIASSKWDYRPGQVVHHEDAEAERLIKAGIAEACPDIVGDAAAALMTLSIDPEKLVGAFDRAKLLLLADAVGKVEDAEQADRLAATLFAPLDAVFNPPLPPGEPTMNFPAAPIAPEAATIVTPETVTPASTPESAMAATEKATGPVPTRRRTVRAVVTPPADAKPADDKTPAAK